MRNAVSLSAHLSRALLDELRGCESGLTARKLALRIATLEQRHTDNPLVMGEMARRVSKSLRRLRTKGVVTSRGDELRQFLWRLAP